MHFPVKMCKSIFITLPKKLHVGAMKVELYRTISLMSHVTKLLLKSVIEQTAVKNSWCGVRRTILICT